MTEFWDVQFHRHSRVKAHVQQQQAEITATYSTYQEGNCKEKVYIGPLTRGIEEH